MVEVQWSGVLRTWRFSRSKAVLSLLLGTLLAVSGCAESARDASGTDDGITLRYADFTAPSSGVHFTEFTDQVSERTNGDVSFRSFWSGSLLKGEEIGFGIRGGIADMGTLPASYNPSEYPLANWIAGLASTVPDEGWPNNSMIAWAANADYVLNEGSMSRAFEDDGLKLLIPRFPMHEINVICRTPVTDLGEAAGKRIRTTGPSWDSEVRELGMVPVSMPVSEVYEALQRGVIDCAAASPKIVTAFGLWEVAKHYTSLQLSGQNTEFVVMNLKTWNNLSEEQQRAILDARVAWMSSQMQGESIDLAVKLREEGPRDHGLEFHEPSPEMAGRLSQFQRQVIDDLPATAPDRVEDPDAYISGYRKSMTEWQGRLHELGYEEGESSDLTAFDDALAERLSN
ncbi:C4-dicarboxylate TRAP transporter substrate-binding protein [Citricoccus parietis]|uniref:C4-dicarboxylate TRAP transporter substrate-binding protein n=1 Tax=Citricoccus parietis TaxID=592307 RepID=A0ABV6F876_9MICC